MKMIIILSFILIPQIVTASKNDSLEKRIDKILKDNSSKLISNSHGTVLYLIGVNPFPLFSFDTLGGWMHENCSDKRVSSSQYNIIQINQLDYFGSSPLHSYVSLEQGRTFSQDGSEVGGYRFATEEKELEPYDVVPQCRSINEKIAIERSCINYSKENFCEYNKSESILNSKWPRNIQELQEVLKSEKKALDDLVVFPTIDNLSDGSKQFILMNLPEVYQTKEIIQSFIENLFILFLKNPQDTNLSLFIRDFTNFIENREDNYSKSEIRRIDLLHSFVSDINLTLDWHDF